MKERTFRGGLFASETLCIEQFSVTMAIGAAFCRLAMSRLNGGNGRRAGLRLFTGRHCLLLREFLTRRELLLAALR